jgi:predicted lipoprotein with Yx(FWY)xxD motif
MRATSHRLGAKRNPYIRSALALAWLVLVLAAAPAAMSHPAAKSGTVGVHTSAYGRILFDGRGFVLYAFTRDPARRSTCYGACAKAWPPFLVDRVRAELGAKASLVGTTRRSDGSVQATYAGRPLYYYVGDREPRQILCQNVLEYGGWWRVVRPDGKPVA